MPDYSQPLESVVARDDQVLRCLVAWQEEGLLGLPDDAQVAERTGLPLDDVRAAARSLQREGLVDARRRAGDRYNFERLHSGVNARTGLWPKPEKAVERLLAALEDAISAASTPERRSRLERVRDALVAGSRALAVTLTGSALGPALGLGG